MLFAPAELNPYEWWIIKNIRRWADAWTALYINSPDWHYARWIGEMEMFKHEGGLKAYERYKQLLKELER